MANGSMEPVDGISRNDPDPLGGELEVLTQFLDYHRATLRMKCAGLDDEQLRRRGVPPSTLSLLGLVRHLTEVERSWFAVELDGQDDVPLYYDDVDRDGDFDNLESTPVPAVWRAYDSAVAESQRVLRTFADPGDVRRGMRREPRNLRWVLAHLIEEYARHNGQADLLRETIDGATGE